MIIKDKTIVLTGASGGIGQAIAVSLHKQQAKLILVGRNLKKLKELNQLIGNQHQIISADLSLAQGRAKLVTDCESQSHVDMLINNAGISHFSNYDSSSDEQINELLNINLLSPMLLTKALLPILKKSKRSIILNIGSSFGGIGYPCFTSYCASKFGLKGFSEALKRELNDTTTKVLYLAPRATDTSINTTSVNQLNKQLGNMTDTPELVAQAVIKQLLKETARVAMGWPEKLFLKVNGIIPSIVDNAISKQLKQIKKFSISVDFSVKSNAKTCTTSSVIQLPIKSPSSSPPARISNTGTSY